jgi:hypothetical protein
VLFAYGRGYLGTVEGGEREPQRMKNQLAGERMVMLTALEARAAAAAVAEAAPPAVETPPEPVPAPVPQTIACTQAGVFAAADARRFETRINRLGFRDRQSRIGVPFQEVTSHLVYLPPNGGKEGADKRVAELKAQVETEGVAGSTGISHTRWATHGAPSTTNAHPHFSSGEIAVVHNGIIENYEQLRSELQALGYVFESQTDTEVIAHLVRHLYKGDLFEAVQAAVARFRGAYAIAVFAKAEPHRLCGARFGSPLVLGVGTGGEHFLASDALALSGTTDRIVRRRHRRGARRLS